MSAGNGDVHANANSQTDLDSEVARRAYERWQARGCPRGDGLRDWLEAEQEILASRTSAATPTAGTQQKGSMKS